MIVHEPDGRKSQYFYLGFRSYKFEHGIAVLSNKYIKHGF